MAIDVTKLEPAEVDPRQLRKTAFLLTAAMVFGGFAILWAYQTYGARTQNSKRPSMEAKITDDARLITADGEERDIQDLKGKVTLAVTLPLTSQPRSEATLAAVERVMMHFANREESPILLAFVLDGDEANPAQMAEVLNQYGEEPAVWRVATGEDGKVSVRAFLKNRMRFGKYPHQNEDGSFDYDSKIVLLDQHLQLRGLPGSNEGWDFERVQAMEDKFARAKMENPEQELIPPPMTLDQLTEMLISAIEYLYAHPNEKGQAS